MIGHLTLINYHKGNLYTLRGGNYVNKCYPFLKRDKAQKKIICSQGEQILFCTNGYLSAGKGVKLFPFRILIQTGKGNIFFPFRYIFYFFYKELWHGGKQIESKMICQILSMAPMLNSAVHEICPANKSQILSNCVLLLAQHC